MPLRLSIAIALSLALHGVLLLPDLLKRLAAAPPPPPLQATLRLPPKPEVPAEPLLKNTLDEEDQVKPVAPPPKTTELPQKKSAKPDPLKREIEQAKRKLSQYVFYPEVARRQGLEGTVTVFLELSADGRVEDVRLISSSGHPILDNAAIKGFYAVGKFPGKSDEWSYTFHLID